MRGIPRSLLIVTAVLLFVAVCAVAYAESASAPDPAQAATPAPAAAATPQPAKPKPPVAVLEIVPVPANARDPNAITTTIKYMTDTTVGPKTGVVALGTTGLTNVPLNVRVLLSARGADPTVPVTKTTWTLTVPQGSKAALSDAAAAMTSFIPDVVGVYKVDVVLANEGGSSPMASIKIHAGTFVGFTAGNCKQCHPKKAEEWAKTGHAKILTEEIDLKPTHYSETCIRCHTTGYYPGANNGGFPDVQAKAKYQFPTWKQIEAGGNWEKMPAEVKNLANIQCEQCHGPAKEHVASGAKVMASSLDDGVCNVCHNGGGHHLKGTDLKNAKHSDATATTWAYASGPARQACVRCHSGAGYVSFIADPKNMASWDNSTHTIGCSTCHDPHSEANTFQLRIVGKPVELPFEAKDVGLSATCYECHNARTKAADAVKGQFPHYSSVAEFLSDTGGVEYGQKVANSPHGMMVGAAPVPNPAAKEDPEADKYLFSTGNPAGNTPGSCVVCHMWPTIEDAKDPNWHAVGSHSFNTVSPDGKFDYTAACKSCHGEVKDFNLPAKADYDGNGKVEGVQDEVKGLLNVLWKGLETAGVKKNAAGYPYATLPKDKDGKTDPKILNAWYNFRTVYGVMWSGENPGNQGAAQAIHNFKRSVMLLQLSYKDLTGKDVPGATLMK